MAGQRLSNLFVTVWDTLPCEATPVVSQFNMKVSESIVSGNAICTNSSMMHRAHFIFAEKY